MSSVSLASVHDHFYVKITWSNFNYAVSASMKYSENSQIPTRSEKRHSGEVCLGVFRALGTVVTRDGVCHSGEVCLGVSSALGTVVTTAISNKKKGSTYNSNYHVSKLCL